MFTNSCFGSFHNIHIFVFSFLIYFFYSLPATLRFEMASNQSVNDFKQKMKQFLSHMDRDIVIKIGEHSFTAHKEILMQRMDYFRAMFTADMQERNQSTISLDATIIDIHAFNAILDLVYNFEVNLIPAILASTLKAADFFCFEEMKTYVKNFMKDNFNANNIGLFTEIMMEFNLTELEVDRKQYIISDPCLNPQELYVLGHSYNEDLDKPTATISKFDTPTQQWIEVSSMPFNTGCLAFTTIDHQIYIYGEDCDEDPPTGVFFKFDTNTQEFTELSPMNHSRRDCSMAYLDGYLYVAGGMDDNFDDFLGMERYSIANDQWTDVSPTIYQRTGLELVALNGYLYAIGGMTSSVERYDPRTDQWKEVASTTDPDEYDNFGSAVLNGRIYIVGINSCEVYDPREDEWKEMPAPAEKVGARRLSVLNGRLITTGGYLGNNLWKRTKKTEYFDFKQDKWLPGKDMNVTRAFHTVAVISKANSSTQ